MQEAVAPDLAAGGSGFRALLKEFCDLQKVPMDAQSTGIEFEADGHVVLMAPHPQDPQCVYIEVVVMDLEEPSAAGLMMLHKINHAARLEHDWVISIDEGHHLIIHTHRPLDTLRSDTLQGLLTEGIERARALYIMLVDPTDPALTSTSMSSDHPLWG